MERKGKGGMEGGGEEKQKRKKACEYSEPELHKLTYSFFFKFYFEMKMKFF